MLGKIDASLNKKLNKVEWGEFKLNSLFDIKNTLSFNTNKLVEGNEYDYVTRTSFNQGVLKKTGFVNKENINEADVWSLGLLQMDFFYRRNPWYAGQFVRKIIPKFKTTENSILFFTTLLNKQKRILLSVLVRDVDKTFNNISIELPIDANGNINFEFIDKFVSELYTQHIVNLEEKRVNKIDAYLSSTNLSSYDLTDKEKALLNNYDKLKFDEFDIIKIFDVKNTGNILSRDIVENSGVTPYLCASSENNAVSSYIEYNKKYLDKGNCIFIGGKTFIVSYQEKDFYSNDSHNLVLYLKETEKTKLKHFYIATCLDKSLSHKYSWGNSISKTKIKNDKILLPSKNGEPDYEIMDDFIIAIQKLVISDVVSNIDKIIETTKKIKLP